MTGILNDTPIKGIDPRIDELINDRLERIQQAVRALAGRGGDTPPEPPDTMAPAYAHMAIESIPRDLDQGDIIDNFELDVVAPELIDTNLATGEFTITDGGVYQINVSGNLDAKQNTDLAIAGYLDGVPSVIDIQVHVTSAADNWVQLGWGGIVRIDDAGVLDFRLEEVNPDQNTITLQELHISMFKVAE